MRLERAVVGACAWLFAAAGCSSAGDVDEGAVALERLVPVEIEAADAQEAWRLFDRSVASGFEPAGRIEVAVELGDRRELSAVKVAGRSAYRLEVLGDDRAPLPGADFDLSQLAAGWNRLPLPEPVSVARPSLRFTPLASGGAGAAPAVRSAIAEVELWAPRDAAPAAEVEDRGLEAALAGEARVSAVEIVASAKPAVTLRPRGGVRAAPCSSISAVLSRHPATLRRAWLTYDADNLFRPFSLRRSLNGGLLEGGAWITASPGPAHFVEPIDPETLVLGTNHVLFCLPDDAAAKVVIGDLRIVGEVERGRFGESARLTTAGGERPAGELVDGRAAGALAVAPGSAVVVELERLVAPDAVLLAPASAASLPWQLRCRTASGEWQALARTEGGEDGALTVDGGQLACSAVSLVAPSAASLGEVTVVGSGAAERIDWPQLRVASPREHFGKLAWVSGWARPPSAAPGPVHVTIDGAEVDSAIGPFGRLLSRERGAAGPWTVAVEATFSSGATLTRTVVLDRDATASLAEAHSAGASASGAGASGASASGASASGGGASGARASGAGAAPAATATDAAALGLTPIGARVSAAIQPTGGKIRLGTRVGVNLPKGAVTTSTEITIQHLDPDQIPPLDPWLVNVTAPDHQAYEFLPHGEQFDAPVEVLLPYDPLLIPDTSGAHDVNTYFYNTDTRAWERLQREAVDPSTAVVTSLTDHFTVMVNAVLVVPESPQLLSYDPTSISSLTAASPAANVDLVEPPAPDTSGDARLSLPIRLPRGRGAYEPSLQVVYSSGQKDGWMGLGWDVPVSRIDIDTRFGVPTYDPGEEPRYTLDAEAIVPVQETDGPACASGGPGRRYRARVEGAFRHVLRCGAGPGSFHFEVHDRSGNLYVYGDDTPGTGAAHASLTSYREPHGVFTWFLREVTDVHGNVTRFRYQLDEDAGGPDREPFRAIYPAGIDYTAHPNASAAYHVEFVLDDGGRPDRLVDGRSGFKRVTRRLLRSLRVRFQSEIIREYVFTYAHGQFQKSVLASARVYGLGGCAAGANAFAAPTCPGAAFFHEHGFDYYSEEEAFSPAERWAASGDGHPLTESHGSSLNGHLYLGVAFAPTKRVSAGVRVGGTVGRRDEDLTFMELNGDGLIDQVFADGTALLNQFTPGPGPGSFSPAAPAGDPAHGADRIPVRGLPGLTAERSASFNTAVQAFIQPVTLGASTGGGLSNARRILLDLDGDMFPDVLGSGQALRGGRCEDDAAFCFTPFSLSGPEQADQGGNPLLGGVQDRFAEALFLAEPVRKWVAPYTGTILLTASAQRTAVGGRDGVVVTLWKDEAQLTAPAALGPTDLGRVDLLGAAGQELDVDAGDVLYLKVGSVKDVAYDGDRPLDVVRTDMAAEYTSTCTMDPVLACEPIDGDEPDMREPTGEPVFSFDAEQDFRLAGAPGPAVVMPAAGTVALRAQLGKVRAVPDDVRVCLQLLSPTDANGNPFDGFTADLPCEQTAPFATQPVARFDVAAADLAPHLVAGTFDVRLGDVLLLRIESDFTVDPRAFTVALEGTGGQPGLRFTSVCRPGSACTAPPGDCGVPPNSRDEVCLGDLHPFVPVPAPRPVGATPLRTFVAPSDGTLAIANTFTVEAGSILAAIRSDRPERNLVLKRAFGTECSGGCDETLNVEVVAGESLTFEFIQFPEGVTPPSADWQAQVGYGDPTSEAPVNRLEPPEPGLPPEFFSGGYRGWWFGAWNAAEPFEPGRLPEIAAADRAALEDVRDNGPPNDWQGPRLPRLFTALSPSFEGAPGSDGREAWIGPDQGPFISDQAMHSARMGARSLDQAVGANLSDELVPRGYLRLALSSSRMLSGGISAGLFDGSFQIGDSETNTTTDVVDMNGDRIADVVTPDGIILGGAGGRGFRLVSGFGAGDGFRHREGTTYSLGLGINPTIQDHTSGGRPLSVQTRMPSTPVGGGVAFSRTQLTEDLHDVNGDGLPDRVRRRGGTVEAQYNLGYRFTGVWENLGGAQAPGSSAIDPFSARESSAPNLRGQDANAISHSTTLTTLLNLGFADPVADYGVSIGFQMSENRTVSDLADLNGDGMPDLLFKKHGEPIVVQYNRGADFAPPVTWTTPGWPAGLLDPPALLGLIARLGGPARDAVEDLTGPDVLSGAGRFHLEDLTRNLEVSGYVTFAIGFIVYAIINPGAGAGIESDSHELSLLDIDGDGSADHVLRRSDLDGVEVKRNQLTGKSNLLRTVTRPLGGAFTLDYARTANTVDMPQSKEVMVRIELDDGVDLGPAFASANLVTDVAYQDGFYDRGEREFLGFGRVNMSRPDGVTTRRRFENRQYALHGHMLEETLEDGAGQLLVRREYTYETRPVLDEGGAALAPQPDCVAALHFLLGPDACTPRFPVATREVLRRREGGPAEKRKTTEDRDIDRFGNVRTFFDGADDATTSDDSTTSISYRNDVARWILGKPDSIVIHAGGPTGPVLRSRGGRYNDLGDLTAIDTDTGSGTATTDLAYDAFGNLARVDSPPNEAGQRQTDSYSFDPVAHRYVAGITDGFGLTSAIDTDLRFGVSISARDANGVLMTRTYDAFGRLATLRGPYDGSDPSIQMSYRHDARPPFATTINRASPPPDYQGPAPAPITTITVVDGKARVIESRKSATVDGVDGMATSGLAQYDAEGRAARRYHPFFTAGASPGFVAPVVTESVHVTRDSLDRVLVSTYPDGVQERAAYSIAASPDGALAFKTEFTDGNGHVRERFFDVNDRTLAIVQHPSASETATSRYRYAPTGDLVGITDAEGNASSLAYDRRGLLTALDNRDTGLIEQQYDLMGNSVRRIEPNQRAAGTSVHYIYDRSRLAAIDYPVKPDVGFVYGAPGATDGRAGRLVRSTDESGQQEFFYGALGEVRRTRREVDPHAPGRQPVVFDTRMTYDSLGRLLQLVYPDGEVLSHTYDGAGKLASVTGAGAGWSRSYVDRLRYDVFGNRTHARFGNGVDSSWSFEPKRVRLDATTSTLPSGDKVQDQRYAYDGVGNVRSMESLLPAPGPGSDLPGGGSWSFDYDGIDRMVHAAGSNQLAPGKVSSYEDSYAHSLSNNLLHKSRAHVISEPSGTPTTPPQTNFDSTFTYAGTRPHAPSQAGDLLLTYDPSGNVIARQRVGTGDTETLTWDDDNRLIEVQRSTTHQRNLYDSNGVRVLRQGRQGETIFANNYFDLQDGRHGVKHVFAGPQRVASSISLYRPEQGTAPDRPGRAYFFQQDHLGSTSVLTDEEGAVHEHVQYFPDGEVWVDRGPQRPVNGLRFSGKRFDPETGFYDFGARFYDPHTSLWLGLDPKLTDKPASASTDPMMLSPYSYAAHSPLTFVDRDGWEPVHIGYVYVIEGKLDGQAVRYTGSTAQELRARFSNHRWKELIQAEGTTVTSYEVKAELNVGASGRGTLRSARAEALRSAEQRIMAQGAKAEGRVALNEMAAATEENAAAWATRHGVRVGRGMPFRGGVKVGAFAGFTLLQVYSMYMEEKRAQYEWAPYLLQDDKGVFSLSYSGLIFHDYYKSYRTGSLAGQQVPIGRGEFNELRDEAEALWGTLDWKGDFVPGILRPRLEVIDPHDGA